MGLNERNRIRNFRVKRDRKKIERIRKGISRLEREMVTKLEGIFEEENIEVGEGTLFYRGIRFEYVAENATCISVYAYGRRKELFLGSDDFQRELFKFFDECVTVYNERTENTDNAK